MRKLGTVPIMLELHNSLLADKSFTYSVPVEWFWNQTEPLSGSLKEKFENLQMLSPTAQVLYASAHAILKHGKNVPLLWFYDLDCLIHSYAARIDWDTLLSQARLFKWGSALKEALFQTQAYFNTPIPDGVFSELSQNMDMHDQWVVLAQTKPATHVLDEFQNLKVMKWYGKILLILGLIVPSPAYMRWRYKLKTAWEVPFYYLIRWWGIFVDGIRTLYHWLMKPATSKS